MNVLGIESSCDETAAAVLKDGQEILSSVIVSQFDDHEIFGGVVPELASRSHVKAIYPVIEKALSDANLSLKDIDGIAVTQGPGLIGSLLVGYTFAKSLAFANDIPFVGVHHIEGHLASAMMLTQDQHYPALGLVVSGGHSHIYYIQEPGHYELVGYTRDDAVGEAFDKAAQILNLGFPGGPAIEKAAREGNNKFVKFPRTKLEQNSKAYEYSFSGIKTSLAYHVRDHQDHLQQHTHDLAASFQQALIDMILYPLDFAIKDLAPKSLLLCGGVARNTLLRESLANFSKQHQLDFFVPDFQLCTDNAVMIAAAGDPKLKQGQSDGFDQAPKASMLF
ncbi:tRNA (adenosine(37)-N6)-threonylcarbamoyltransferase complex transferase subunit TsaD [bacterium]|nr:tRNA (adenosine(37)-N6)-threonylcarbamoyltransferase complex transferase subunit TsaD [bacterium]